MIVADTSAWVEMLRGTGSPVDLTMCRLIAGGPLAVTEMVVGELLTGARSPAEAKDLRRRLTRHAMLPLHGLLGFQAGAELARDCRRRGVSTSLVDCLVAVPAIWAGAPLLHADGDFDAIASVSALEVHPADDG